MAVKQCSKCGTSFGCCNEISGLPAEGFRYDEAKAGCWCENYELSLDTLKELKKEFENCLCESCLKTYALAGSVPGK